jgi:uncharacterized membrane protein
MNPRRDWFAGVVLGAWIGFSLIYFAIVGAVLLIGFAIGAAIARSLAALGGVLLGAGALLLLILALANANCAGLFDHDEGGCTPPDLTGFLVAGLAMALVGGVLTIRAITGDQPSQRDRF